MLIVILLMFTVAVLPISIAFYGEDQMKPAWLTINTLVDTLFMSDLVVNFRTGIFSEDIPDQVNCSKGQSQESLFSKQTLRGFEYPKLQYRN